MKAVQAKGEATVASIQAMNAVSPQIVAAIWAARPIINVTNVTKGPTIQERHRPPKDEPPTGGDA